jgi:U3 small nucleolar ribonucleoprotein protein IMP4
VVDHVDDEYRWAGVVDPKIIITTSHAPSSRLKQFAKEMKLIFPNSQRINRGNYQIKQLVDACRTNECTDLVILHETRGQPGKIYFLHNRRSLKNFTFLSFIYFVGLSFIYNNFKIFYE